MEKLFYLFKATRPTHFIKNFFVFAALIFSGNLLNLTLLWKVSETFLIFSLLSGSVYLINDLFDLKEDKIHPKKKKRPLASGKLKTNEALFLALFLALLSLTFSFLLNFKLGIVSTSYFSIFFLYSLFLKKILILDVFIIALGLVLRVVAGALVIFVPLSHFILICTFFLGLFLGFSKRKYETSFLPDLEKYSPYFLNQLIIITTALTILSYALYTLSSETIFRLKTDKLIYTLPFVVYGIFRYLYLVQEKEKGDPTETILTDNPLLLNILLWVIFIIFILYF